MKIYVEGREIETKDIVQIRDVKPVYNGFIVCLTGERFVHLSESCKMGYKENESIKQKYNALKEKVIEKWNEDKTDFIVLNL